MNNEPLTPAAIVQHLPTRELPRQVLCYPQVTSTMEVAREQLRAQPAEAFPLLITAEQQTAGRGRMGRPWSTSYGDMLLFSLVLRPAGRVAPDQVQALVWLMGVSTCQAIAQVTPLKPVLKWPNDVLLPLPANDTADTAATARPGATLAKIAGILLESGSSSSQIDWAIIGCGINVNAGPALDTPLRYPATSLAATLGSPVSRLALLRAIVQHCDEWYHRLGHGQLDALFMHWRSLLVTIGLPVEIALADRTLLGTAEDVEPSGALLVRDADGTLHTIHNGDIGG